VPYFGVCYGPYHRNNVPPPGRVTADDVDADMAIINAKGFTHIRTYGAADGNRFNIEKAGKHGLKVGLGIWIPNNVQNNSLIDDAVQQAAAAESAHPGRHCVVDMVIGNEVNRTDDKAPLAPNVILSYMQYAKQNCGRGTHLFLGYK
jgi:exo-beta-1,3-glucanase (GH17 family)